jgi:uncharacterized protein YjbI with pentapeptide repeats
MKTKQLIFLITILLSALCFTGNSFGVTLKEGLDALDRGDLTKAANIFKALANQGDPEAQHNLSLMLSRGMGGLPKSERHAFGYMKKSAKQGLADAEAALGEMYLQGIGVRKNQKEAIKWYQLAADHGNSKAKKALEKLPTEQKAMDERMKVDNNTTKIKQNTMKLKMTKKCKHCSLIGADLTGLNLSKNDLTDANLTGANLEGVDMRGATLYKALFTGANLKGANLQEAHMSEAVFTGANLKGANLQKAHMSEAVFKKANLSGANLKDTIHTGSGPKNSANCMEDEKHKWSVCWNGVNFEDANLSNAKLNKAGMKFANLSGANLAMADLRGADLEYIKADGINLSNAKMQDVKLSRADLTGANIAGANLEGVTWSPFDKINLTRANLTGASLEGFDADSSILCKTIMPWGEDNSGCK